MPGFIRRMLEGTAYLRSPDDEGGTPPPLPGTDTTNAGGDPPQPDGGTDTPDAGTAGTSTPEGGTPPETPPSGETPPAAPDRNQQRMNSLVAERWAERRRAEEAETRNRILQEQLNQARAAVQPAQIDPATGQPTVQQQVAPQVPPPDLNAMAAQIAETNAFNASVLAEVQRGRDPARGGHADFDSVAANLQQFGELPKSFVEAALATGKGAEVIYTLGRDIVEANRILTMPPVQQAVALANLAAGIATPTAPKTITSAPAPITPKIGAGKSSPTPSLDDNNMPIADWIKLREKNLPKRASR